VAAGLAAPVAGPGPAPCPLVLACVCHPGCASARCGLGPGVARAGADSRVVRRGAGCVCARGRWLIRPAIPGWATPPWPSGWCWARARFAKSVRWPSQMVTGLPGPLRRHSAPIAE